MVGSFLSLQDTHFLTLPFNIRWMFEKYDGVRGFWNPMKRVFYSRHGKKLTLPPEIIDLMPNDIFLDGELWYGYFLAGLLDSDSISIRFGRETFQEATKLAHGSESSQIDWSKFKYVVFDVPKNEGNYSERYAQLGTPCYTTLASLLLLTI